MTFGTIKNHEAIAILPYRMNIYRENVAQHKVYPKYKSSNEIYHLVPPPKNKRDHLSLKVIDSISCSFGPVYIWDTDRSLSRLAEYFV